LAGKIVFVDEHMTRTQDGSGYRVAVRKRSGAANEAGKRGAIAALIRSVGTDQHRFPHTGQMNYAEQVRKVPIAALSAPDADQVQRALLLGEVEVKLSLEVESMGPRLSGNVIGEIPGKTDEIVVIGGHLDSWDLGTGAVDDGAGIGITLGAAKMILDLNRKPQRTIRVVMFGSEEVGLVGAKAYAEGHKDELYRHVIGAESDFGGGKIWRFDTLFGEDKLHFAAAMHAVLGPLGIALGNNSASGGPDMGPMRALGVPVATLKQNGWDYFDLHHTANDTFDKIKPDDIAQNVAAYAAFAWMAANLDGHFRASPD
jgi:carboxypeptidase Q